MRHPVPRGCRMTLATCCRVSRVSEDGEVLRSTSNGELELVLTWDNNIQGTNKNISSGSARYLKLKGLLRYLTQITWVNALTFRQWRLARPCVGVEDGGV